MLSATQIDLWIDCRRKWAFKYLEHLEAPKHSAAILGTETQDEQLDPYLATGRSFDHSRPSGEIAQQLVPLLPLPITHPLALPGLRLRRKFEVPSPSGRFWYRGEFDLWHPSSAALPGLAAELRAAGHAPAPLLGDIKTSGNLDYAKTPDRLRTDTQAQIYSAASMVEDEVDELDLAWLYTKTRKAYRAMRVHLRVKASGVFEQFERIDAIGIELVTIKAQAPKANELPPNVRMCESYGGCPYRHVCNLSPAVQAAAINEEAITMNHDFLNSLRKTPAAPIAGVAPAPVHAIAPALLAPVEFKHIAPQAATVGVAPAFVPPPVQHAAPPVPPAINPPEAALPPAPPVNVAPSAQVEAPKATRGPGRPKAEPPTVGPTLEHLDGLVQLMKAKGVKRLELDGMTVTGIEVV